MEIWDYVNFMGTQNLIKASIMDLSRDESMDLGGGEANFYNYRSIIYKYFKIM